MDFLCLAAGKGTRMGSLGSYLQKCMYPIGLRPFLDYTIHELLASRSQGSSEDRLTIVVGHHADQVRNYFGDGIPGLSISYVVQHEPLGTGHALKVASDAVEPTAPVIAWLADSYVPRSVFEALQTNRYDNTQTLGRGDDGESPQLRPTVDGDRVTRAWDGVGDLYDIGVWKLAPQALAEMATVRAENGEFRALPNLQRSLEAGAKVGWVEAKEWVHLGGVHPTAEANVNAVVERLLSGT